ncbi:MAG: IS110 family transposase [Bacteroidales bacterium]|nr:MAG: IS110 family transposase [Bacteroidales bacterium]
MKRLFIKQNIGIDISKDDCKGSLFALTNEYDIVTLGTKTFTNTLKGFLGLLEWVKVKGDKNIIATFTMEATGVYYENLAYFLVEQGFTVHVVLPNQSKKYAESLGAKSKTDKIDSRILAQMGIERKLLSWQPLSSNFVSLKQLTRERDAIIQERINVSNQLHAYKHQRVINSSSISRSEKRIAALNVQIKEIEREIAEIVKCDKVLNKRLDNLQSIPGVGLITAVTIVAETNGFISINNIKQLTSFAGLDVRIAESGKWKGKSRISKKGNSHIRKALYFPTFTKIQFDIQTKQYYERLKTKKAKPMIAAVAVQRKLLGLIYTLWKKEERFCPNYRELLAA